MIAAAYWYILHWTGRNFFVVFPPCKKRHEGKGTGNEFLFSRPMSTPMYRAAGTSKVPAPRFGTAGQEPGTLGPIPSSNVLPAAFYQLRTETNWPLVLFLGCMVSEDKHHLIRPRLCCASLASAVSITCSPATLWRVSSTSFAYPVVSQHVPAENSPHLNCCRSPPAKCKQHAKKKKKKDTRWKKE